MTLPPPAGTPTSQVTEEGNPEGGAGQHVQRPGEEQAGLTQPLVSSWARF